MKKCNNCGVCWYVKETKSVQATATKFKVEITSSADYSISNIIYLLGCTQCPQQYIGESERIIRTRFLGHKEYVNSKNTLTSAREHFNLKGHCSSDMYITIIEQILNQDPQFRKQCKKMFMQKFHTRYRMKIENCIYFSKKYIFLQFRPASLILYKVDMFWNSLMWGL